MSGNVATSSNHSIKEFLNPDKTQTQQIEKIPRNFVKNSLISKHLICTICQEVFDDPKRIDCGHTFCSSCILQWAGKSLMCPICRQKFSKDGIPRDLIAYNIINDMEVTCSNSGCPWKDSLLNLKEHLFSCYFDKNKMPSYIKNFVVSSAQENTNIKPSNSFDDDDKVNSNDYLNFNCNIGLKARLYQRNKDLMEKVLKKNNVEDSDKKRDSLFDFLIQK